MEASDPSSLENLPGIFVVGSSNVGKRTLLSRLLSVDYEGFPDSSSELFVHGWTIDTKYYTADVSVGLAHLQDGFSLGNLPISNRLDALVMVFDMTEPSTLVALQDWMSGTDTNNFKILICIGNKVDLVPGHPVHAEYRRRLLKVADYAVDPYSDSLEFGISETEGACLLGNEEPSLEIRKSCLEWCCEHNIEFIEACASNAEFDKCLSVDGDSQGVERLFGALSAHMWPGMILKSGDKITEPILPQNEELSEEESDYELEYEVLSAGSADPWEDIDERWVSASEIHSATDKEKCVSHDNFVLESNMEKQKECGGKEMEASTSTSESQNEIEKGAIHNEQVAAEDTKAEKDNCFEFEDLEQLMSEIGNVRDSLRLMPDFQRREMAAKLAMKMASMFGGDSDNEDGHY